MDSAKSSADINGLVQERRNSSALAMELRLSCTNASTWHWLWGYTRFLHSFFIIVWLFLWLLMILVYFHWWLEIIQNNMLNFINYCGTLWYIKLICVDFAFSKAMVWESYLFICTFIRFWPKILNSQKYVLFPIRNWKFTCSVLKIYPCFVDHVF